MCPSSLPVKNAFLISYYLLLLGSAVKAEAGRDCLVYFISTYAGTIF